MEEIKRRTQGSNENIGFYLAVMQSLFSRLSFPLSETVKLRILLRNILPFYQTQLGLVEITSITQLLKLGRQLEAKKEAVESYVPPSFSASNSLEPDLAYIDLEVNSSSVDAIERNITCYNCKRPGHTRYNCKETFIKKCYNCGKIGFTVRTCPNCKTNSGNANRSH